MGGVNPLIPGDTVALLAPASAVKPEYCDGAEEWLESHGFRVRRYPSAGGVSGSYSASEEVRIAELKEAFCNPEIKGILCARGGYGCVQLLEEISPTAMENPKWIIGFSDISALHAMMQTLGFRSLHAPMAKHLTLHPSDSVSRAILTSMTSGIQPEVVYPTDRRSVCGVAQGMLIGGNLAVINGLADTPWDPFRLARQKECILFIEDISEAIYAVERMLFRLYLSGTLNRLKGLIVGQFTEYRPDRNFDCMEDMISKRLRQWEIDIPTAFDFPAGHVEGNYPLILGQDIRLVVTPETTALTKK